MKILIHSNSCWSSTGYGNQTRTFAPLFNEHGHETAVSAFWGLHGAVLEWNGIRHYPALADGYGNDVVQAHAQHWFGKPRDGIVISLIDVWVLDPGVWSHLNAACWCPIDHDPLPPAVADFFRQSAAVPVAMSRFGRDQLAEFEPLYVPHGVDTDTLRPIPRAQARERLDIPDDRFVVGMVAANKGVPSRKSFSEAFQAFARFREDHKDAILYLHTVAAPGNQGEQLVPLLQACGIPPESVRFPDQYIYQCAPSPVDHMAHVYSSMDVLMNPARGEGFGLPVLEAQACGVPVIVTDHSAMREVGMAGWHVGGQRCWTPQCSWQLVPDVDQLVHSLDDAYRCAGTLAAEARVHALCYDHRRVMEEFWLPALARLEQRFQDREPVTVKAAA